VDGAAQPGRATVPFSGGAAALQLRVLARQAGSAQIRVGSFKLSAGGQPVEPQLPAPLQVNIAAQP
jgi:hypothetical protein